MASVIPHASLFQLLHDNSWVRWKELPGANDCETMKTEQLKVDVDGPQKVRYWPKRPLSLSEEFRMIKLQSKIAKSKIPSSLILETSPEDESKTLGKGYCGKSNHFKKSADK